MNRSEKYTHEVVCKRLEEQTQEMRQLKDRIEQLEKDKIKLFHIIDSMSGIIRRDNKIFRLLGLTTNISNAEIDVMKTDIESNVDLVNRIVAHTLEVHKHEQI